MNDTLEQMADNTKRWVRAALITGLTAGLIIGLLAGIFIGLHL